MAGKLGVYLCAGCGIGEALDLGQLAKTAEGAGASVRRSHAFCLEDAALIRADVEGGTVNGAVIAACSPRVNRDVFRFPEAVVERVNLREQVVWSHPPGAGETQSMAGDLLAMGLACAARAEAPKARAQAAEGNVLVVGAGMAGVSAALSAARSGLAVTLVEREERLGGYAARLYRQFGEVASFAGAEMPAIEEKSAALAALANVTVHLRSRVVEIAGEPGRFKVRIAAADGTEREAIAGAIVLATGWRPLETAKYARYGLGSAPDVVTSLELEEMARHGTIVRPSDGRPAGRVAFVLCDGHEDDAHLPYGGSVASLVALKQALYVRLLNPHATAFIFYGDLQTPGRYEYFYESVQADPGVMLCQGASVAVKRREDGALVVAAEGTPLGPSVELPVDLVVLSAGMVPELGAAEPALNLRYLQGKGVPVSKFGFAESNFICFPYESRRSGIYAAGAVRQAMDLAAAERDGRAAALKAIQAIERSATGEALHPRSGDLSFPGFFLQKCTSCGRCTQECPFGALELNERKNPVLNVNRCRRCGICMGACPVQIISFSNYSVDMLSAMIRAVEIPEAPADPPPRILVFACENDAYPALDMAGLRRLHWSAALRIIPVRCLGSVNSILVTDAVSRGFDGVALLGCRPGEDYQCHFIQGSELLGTRMVNMRETLGRLMLEPERVSVLEVAISDFDKLPAMLEEFVDTVQQLGPNPMKGF